MISRAHDFCVKIRSSARRPAGLFACLFLALGSLAGTARAAAAPSEIVNIARASYVNKQNIAVTLVSAPVRALRQSPAPAVKLLKTASNMAPKTGEEVTFVVKATGSDPASGTGVETIVDGVAQTLVVLRDAIPAQTQFARFGNGSSAGFQLYHRSGDPLQTYATSAPGDLKTVDAVALAVAPTNPLAPAAQTLSFVVLIKPNANGAIVNTAQFFAVEAPGVPPSVTSSNTVSLAPTRPVDPFGIVFDSKTNAPIAGARVTLIDASSGTNARVFNHDGSPASNQVLTASDGRYSFPVIPPGSYRLEVLPPPGWDAPSKVVGADLPKGRNVDRNASYDLTFTLDTLAGDFVFDIPVDRVADQAAGIFVQKLASRQFAEIGDFVDYTVRIKNVSGHDLTDVVLDDELPHGFAFEQNSALLNGRDKLRSASGSSGPRIKFSLGLVAKDQLVTVNYRTRIGADAAQGDGINRAQASNQAAPRTKSNIATAQVQLQEGVFTTRGVIIGKVFLDKNHNRVQDAGEPGIPGVRLFIEDGSYVISDGDGKYSFYGVNPRTHILKLDKITLPKGAELEVLDTRNAGTAGTRFVDLKNSEMHKANFAVGNATPEILAQIAKLKAAADKIASESSRNLKADLTRDGQPLYGVNADRRSQPASGVIVPGVAVQPTQDVRSEGAGSLILGDQRFNFGTGSANPRSFTQPLFQDPTPDYEMGDRRPAAPAPIQGVPPTPSAAFPLPGSARVPRAGEGVPPSRTFDASSNLGNVPPTATAEQVRSGGTPEPARETRALPGNRTAERTDTTPAFEPLLPGSPSDPGEIDLTLFDNIPSNEALVPAVPLEMAVAVSAPAATANRAQPTGPIFLDLRDGDTLPMAQATVRVQGRAGAAMKLKVNGVEVVASRIGKRVTDAERGIEALEFIGVALVPGSNELEIAQVDSFGNSRGSERIHVIAPDKLGGIKLTLPAHDQAADGHTPAHIIVELLDAHGVRVTARTELTLEATLGAWNVRDLNEAAPGIQTFIEGGRAEFDVLAPVEPGDCKLRVSSGVMRTERKLAFLPDLRPMLAAGLVEGRVNLTHFNAGRMTKVTKRDTFEQELNELSIGGDDRNASARAAFFLKGKIKGDYLLTAAYDSEREVKERLFRDIQPDEFYPVYGDSSVKGFEAQSSGPLYIRIDKKRSYLLYGDFVTQAPGDFRQLGTYNRSLTGVREHYENSRVSGSAWASFDSTKQIIEELPANGTSGPYFFNVRKSSGLANSEKVEILVRARNNPGLIVKTETRTRFSDYEFEPFTGRILFKAPVPSLDADLNQISIRVTYEADQGGPKFWTYGADGQVKITSKFEVGGSFAREENPLGTFGLYSANAVYELGKRTFLIGEFAHTEDQILGSGNAYRFELRHQGEGTAARIFWGRAEAGFHNPGSVLTSGRTEGGAQIAVRLGKNTRLLIEGVDTESAEGGKRLGGAVAVEQSFKHDVRVEVGGRYSTETGTPASASTALSPNATPNVVRSARVKLSAPVPFTEQRARVFGEYEQDVFDADKRMAAIGGEYQVDPKTRLYARHELISSLGGPFEINSVQRQNSTVVGVESTYAKDAQLFNEYRARNGISGRENEAAIGLRNTWPLAPGLRALTSFERVAPLTGSKNVALESTAVTGALEYTANPDWKGTARLELRKSDTTDSLLNTLGVAYKINRDWTALGKTILYVADNKAPGAGDQTQARIQAGAAWRPTENDRWNGLGKYEFKTEDDGTKADFNVARKVHIVSLDANFQPTPDFTMSGHYAAKLVFEDSNNRSTTTSAHLVAVRAIYDLSKRWDIGINSSALADSAGGLRYGIGPEIGFTLMDNLRVGIGYNFIGFEDRDLSEEQYTQQGFYLALRFKFDEELWQRKRKENR